MSAQNAWAYLSRVVEGPSRPLQDLLAAGRTAEEIARGVRTRAGWIGGLLRETEARHTWDRAAEDLETAQRHGARLITPEDAEWPAVELDQAFAFAASGVSEHLRTYQSDAVAPHALWVRGAPLAGLLARAVAVVGTRAVSTYGTAATEMLVSDLAAHRWAIVSGGAVGVDAVAHRAALAARTPTIVVAACGIDRIYPKQNAELFAQIAGAARGGAVISEYPPGTTPQRHRFLTRNRLVAALTQGTVVVEAAWRSGALNTLSWAEGLGRVAMAVPGPVTSNNSLGCHSRIRDGRAQLVTGGPDIRALLESVGTVDPEGQYELSFAADEVQSLTRSELRIFDALPPSGAVGTEELARAAGMTVPLCVTILVDLAKRGVVHRVGNAWERAGS